MHTVAELENFGRHHFWRARVMCLRPQVTGGVPQLRSPSYSEPSLSIRHVGARIVIVLRLAASDYRLAKPSGRYAGAGDDLRSHFGEVQDEGAKRVLAQLGT